MAIQSNHSSGGWILFALSLPSCSWGQRLQLEQASESSGGPAFLNLQVWAQAWEFLFLTCPQVMVMLVVWGPHFENHWSRPMLECFQRRKTSYLMRLFTHFLKPVALTHLIFWKALILIWNLFPYSFHLWALCLASLTTELKIIFPSLNKKYFC